MIPLYFIKPFEEIARAVVGALIGYILGAVYAGTVQPTQESLVALAIGAVPIIYAALRKALNNTPLTPPTGSVTPIVPDATSTQG